MTTDAVGGVWTFATTLAHGLAEAGFEIHIVAMGPEPHDDQREVIRHPKVNLISTDLSLEWQDPAGENLRKASDLLRELERSIRPDLVHLNSYREASFGWTAPVVVTAHSCVVSWAFDCNHPELLAEAHWRQYRTAVGNGLNSATAWVAPTHAFRRAIGMLYRPNSAGAVIWNGTRLPTRNSHKDDFVLTAGRMWDEAKNLGTLVEAARQSEWPLKVAGHCSSRPDTLPDNVELLGQLSSRLLRQQMQRASIFASPSVYEPFGLCVLEAASAGCALVLSDIPSFRELWEGAAVFVDPRNVAALEYELNLLTSDNHRRRELQRAARQRSSRYSADRTTTAYRSLYTGLMSRPQQFTEQLAGVNA